jgi:hypothetical protein
MFKAFKVASWSGGANCDIIAGDVKAALIDTDDVDPDVAANGDVFLDDISAAVVATSSNLSGKAFSSAGVFDCDDFVLSSVSGDISEAIVFYIDTATPATSRLVARIDTGTGLPFTPVGDNINVVISGSGLFAV